jgi:hypothetical protein
MNWGMVVKVRVRRRQEVERLSAQVNRLRRVTRLFPSIRA